MAFDKTVPATSLAVKNGWPLLLQNQSGLETAIDQDHDFATGGTQTGKHDRVTLLDAGGDEAGVAGALTIWQEAGVPKWRQTTGTVRLLSSDGDVIDAGTEMWFYADTAPAGWTINGTPSDELLAVKGGATYTTGGVAAGSWTVPDHLHTTPDHTLITSEIPSHRHELIGNENSAGSTVRTINKGAGSQDTFTSYEGGGAAHNHGNTGNSASAGFRPHARVGIICSKDAY